MYQQHVSSGSGKSAMTGGVAESWARLRLVQGDSSAQVWELVASRGQTTLTVGSGPSSSWVIREEGVRPLHFSLHWDGATLRIADTYGAGDVRVDGAQVTAQWRPIVGRARIDFGKAAMVAETSAGAETGAHPLEPSPLPPMTAAVSLEAATAESPRGTLPGNAPLPEETPLELVTPKSSDSSAPTSSASSAPTTSASSAPTGSDSLLPQDGTGSFRVARPSDSERVRKATLLGVAVNVPPPAPVPVVQAPEAPSEEASKPAPVPIIQGPEARGEEAKKPAAPARGIPSGTLIGVVGPLEARVQRLASAAVEARGPRRAQDYDGKLSDKRTMLGVPLRDLQIGGDAAAPQSGRAASDAPGIVTQPEVRVIAAPPAASPAERIGSTWQEIPNVGRPGSTPMAVLVDEDPPGRTPQQTRAENEGAPSAHFDPRARPGVFDARDRASDIPTQMRDVATLESRRPKPAVPLRYIGIVVLTAAAYLAWLYLLDHL